jgi:hypothetical protein
VELPPNLVDVLTVVRDSGPLSRREIALALGYHPALCQGRGHGRLTGRLVALGLFARLKDDRYTLTDRAMAHTLYAPLGKSPAPVSPEGGEGEYFPAAGGVGDLD